MGVRLRFGDEVGLITNRMCLDCGNYVYENDGIDPNHRFDVRVFICIYCNDSLLPIEAETQAQVDERVRFVAELERTRYIRVQAKAENKRREMEQMSLWGDDDDTN